MGWAWAWIQNGEVGWLVGGGDKQTRVSRLCVCVYIPLPPLCLSVSLDLSGLMEPFSSIQFMVTLIFYM